MAYTTIKKSTDHFNTKLYTGNAGTNAITGVGFQPDFTWIKNRPDAKDHQIYDAVRGATKVIGSDRTSAEATVSNGLTAFGTDGFTVGNDGNVNDNGDSHVAWNWKANGAGSANSDGATATTVSANTTAGFSIVKYTGTGTTTNFGHGLGVKPNVILIKSLSSNDWVMNGDFLGSTTWQHKMILNTTAAKATANNFNDQAPTNSIFYLNSAHGTTNGSGTDYIAYCFAEKKGYSKFGSYTGNGNDDGPFIYTGFKPAFLLFKETSSGTNDSWFILDNKRNTYNPESKNLRPNNSDAEADSSWMKVDFLSNGFKLKDDDASINESGKNYIYMAFAAEPLVGDNPATAR